jgi:hypothetical protein
MALSTGHKLGPYEVLAPTDRLWKAGIPTVLFPTRIPVDPKWDQFAVAGNGQRFLLLESIETEAKPFTIVLNLAGGGKALSPHPAPGPQPPPFR